MAKTKKYVRKAAKSPGRAKRNPGMKLMRSRRYKRNPGMFAKVGSTVSTALFALVGGFGSKLGTQAVLGANNTGMTGYATNLVVGVGLWFLGEKVLKNRVAADGLLAGSILQIALRILNDKTPFGQYIGQLGMGDYQMQSFVTPQVLVDPMRNADVQIPDGWAPQTIIQQLPAAPGAPASGMSGLYSSFGKRGGLYSVAA